MPRTRDELRAELKTEAERLIDELLAWSDQVDAPTLTEIEDQVLKVRKAFGEKLADVLLEKQLTVEPLTVKCPECGRAMHQKKKRQRRRVESRAGQLTVNRAYYYCDRCQVGLFPPGPAVASRRPPME